MQNNSDDSRRSKTVQGMLLTGLAITAVVVYLCMNHLMLTELIDQMSDRAVYKTIVYLLWMACGFVVFFGVLVTADRLVLAALLLVSCVSITTNYAYAVISQKQFTPDLMEWMVHEIAQFPQAWAEFRPDIVAALLKVVAILAVFVLIRSMIRRHRLSRASAMFNRRGRTIALVSFLAFHGLAMLIQPSYSVAETNTIVFGVPALFSRAPQLRSVPVRPATVPLAEKIVFVVDESVGHEAYETIITPVLRDVPVLDFGEAAAFANCSAASNALLRWGLEKSYLSDTSYDPRTNPTIWGFAKAAGFTTTLIDGQSKGATQNYVSNGELALIDEFISASVGLDTDQRIAMMLRERLQRPGRDFIFVIKRGSHFPYEMNYPEGMIPPGAPKAEKYATAVSYTTGRFFAALTSRLPLVDVLLIYTSDHGQDLNNRTAHCSDNPAAAEYSVPMIVLTQAPRLKELLAPAVANMRNRTSHLNIFPTLLYGFGYAPDWITAAYGPTLAGPAAPYVILAWHLPYPSKRKPVLDLAQTMEFPGRQAGRKAH